MSEERYETRPGDFELRILPDGRVCIVAADEEVFDLAEALAPDDPCILRRRKAKASGKSGNTDPGG